MAETVDITRGTYRRVYSGFITGRRICAVSVEAEAWFWRLQAVADDFGNLPGDALIVWQQTVGRRSVTMQTVSKWVEELVRAGLLLRYSEGDDHYLHITYWSEDSWPAPRNGKRAMKYPRPRDKGSPGASRCIQVHPGESGCIQVLSVSGSEPEPEPEPEPPAKPDGGGAGCRFSEFWQAFPQGVPNRKQDRKKCEAAWISKKLDQHADRILADVQAKRRGEKWTKDKGAYIEAPLVYLNNERWLDSEPLPGAPNVADWKAKWLALQEDQRRAWIAEFQVLTKGRQTRPNEWQEWVSEKMANGGAA